MLNQTFFFPSHFKNSAEAYFPSPHQAAFFQDNGSFSMGGFRGISIYFLTSMLG